MEKGGLEERVSSTNEIVKWATKCIWSGIAAGLIVSPIMYGRVLSSEQSYTPAHEKTILTVLGSFIISGLVVGSILYYLLKRRKSKYFG